MEPNDESKPRQIKDGPWCWQHKSVLRMITDTFSESDQAASARSLYVAMTELASDNESDTFTATKALIAHKAGLSVSTVQRLLNGFEQLGVVRIERGFAERNSGAIRAPNTYTLLSIGHGDSTTLGHGRSRANPDKDEEKKEKRKTLPMEGTHHLALRAADAADSFSRYDEEEKEKIQCFHQQLSDNDWDWLPVEKYSDRVSDALALLPDLETAKVLFGAARILVSKGEDEGTFTFNSTGEQFECYLPLPNKRTGKRTLVRLIQCNRDTIPDMPDPPSILTEGSPAVPQP
jgi:hypothetical protein